MTLTNTLAEAYASWLASASQCCAPLSNSLPQDRTQQSRSEKPQISIVRDQPAFVQAPFLAYEYEAFRPSTRASTKERVRKSFSSTRTSLSARRRLRSSHSARPQISAPSNFRHLNSESFQFPAFEPQVAQPRRASFRPLQLSIYQTENGLSPILPLFDPNGAAVADLSGFGRVITPPPLARVRGGSDADSTRSRAMTHERSYSSMSFHVPRRGQPGDSPKFNTTPQRNASSSTPPQIPPKSRARARAYTSPETERLAERIASAILEKEKLQELIDEAIERQSIYLGGSRPSTAHSMAFSTLPGVEPMPAIPALPPTAPSFAERLNTSTANLDRPNTAPSRSPVRPRYFDEIPLPSTSTPAVFNPLSSNPTRITAEDRPLQPPLPLVLRPPLRKKKSFSRVSTWLFPAGEHGFDSITNQPRPVRGDEGFYQSVFNPSESHSPRRDSVSSLSGSSWETEDDDERTMPTTWSPASSPASKTPVFAATDLPSGSTLLDRVAAFGAGKESVGLTPTRPAPSAGEATSTTGPRRERVGVAF